MAGHVVADAGPLIHLTQADCLHLLAAFDEVSIPQTVLEEASGESISDALALMILQHERSRPTSISKSTAQGVAGWYESIGLCPRRRTY